MALKANHKMSQVTELPTQSLGQHKYFKTLQHMNFPEAYVLTRVHVMIKKGVDLNCFVTLTIVTPKTCLQVERYRKNYQLNPE